MTQQQTAEASNGLSPSGILGAVTDGQTYKNLLYLMIAPLLGMFYYIILVTGFTLGLGLSVIGIGLGILLLTLVCTRYAAGFERRVANRLLGTDIAAPDDLEQEENGIVALAKAYIGASSTWQGLAFVFAKFWVGIVSFMLLVATLGIAIELLLMPVFPNGTLDVTVSNWEVAQSFESTAEQVAAVPVGAVLTIVALNVLNAFANLNATIASALLGPTTGE
ncbi:MAG: hypothetical protein J07HX64_01891 [halophilic archaeon J07HX64]|jgi:hypothetical protein|nr:MAG: hypothetical protein J07HX64_01891 [halophilic archaeon J07HX64]